jgi:PAS domain S-box-containing protein
MQPGGYSVLTISDWTTKINQEMRAISDSIQLIARTVHDHAQKLEVAVEGRKITQESALRLLSDSLNLSRRTDTELGRLNRLLQRITGLLQNPEVVVNHSFEHEREAMASNISSLQKQRHELATLYEIARVLNSTLELDDVLRLVMDQVIAFVRAERGFLVLINPQNEEPEFTIARDKAQATIPASAFATAKISRSTIRRVIQKVSPELTSDAQFDDALSVQESVIVHGIRSLMCAPLIVRDHCIGAVYVDSRASANLFGEGHLELLQAFCHQAAIAIDNARLFADLHKALRNLEEDKRYMDNIFGSIANGVVTTDSDGIITACNAAAALILNLPSEEALGKHYTDFLHTFAHVGLIDLLRDARLEHEHGTVVHQPYEGPLAGRGDVSLNFYVSALRDAEGNHIGTALVIDDRTELKRAQARAREIRTIFERFVHPKVVHQLIQDPAALKLGGETKEISVLFADIRGYTRLSERMAPEEVMNLINRYLKIMCEAIWEEEGTITAFLGDAVMAIFNAPLPQKKHALHAVRAAWKMRLAVLEYQQQHSQAQEQRITFGFGINSGLATVGNVGSQGRLQNYTAIGDVVNVASRLQGSVSDNNILVNDPTFMQVYRYVQTGQPFQMSVKNREAPLTVRYLFGIN